MIKLNEYGEIDLSKLDYAEPLPEKIIKEGDYKTIKKEFDELVAIMNLNQYYHACYESFLKYNFDDDLRIVTIEDPNYRCETWDKWRRNLDSDSEFRVYTKEQYQKEVALCENLLYKVRDSFNSLPEFERFLIKNASFTNERDRLSDEIIIMDSTIYKDKFYLIKKSAYIKLGYKLNLNFSKKKDDEIKRMMINYISKHNLITIEEDKIS